MTLVIHRMKKTTYDSIIIAKTVWKFLHYGIERKMGVILRCKLATHNE